MDMCPQGRLEANWTLPRSLGMPCYRWAEACKGVQPPFYVAVMWRSYEVRPFFSKDVWPRALNEPADYLTTPTDLKKFIYSELLWMPVWTLII